MGYFFPELGGYVKLPKWKDPFSDGIPRKYWDLSYYTDKPKSYSQMSDQMFVGAFFQPLTAWHQASEAESKFKHTMSLYGLKFEDVKYPYLTALGGSASALGSGVRGALQVSRNITRLYR